MTATPIFLAGILLVLYTPGPAGATALGDLAAQMQPGEWRELADQNLAKDTILNRNVNGQFHWADMSATWSNYLSWNPATQELYWLGAPHLAPFGFLRYSAAENRWHSETGVPDCMRLPGYEGCFNHGYDDGTIDPVRGIFYFHSGKRLFAYRIADKTWSEWNLPNLADARASALEYFPPLDRLAYTIGTAVADGGLVQLIHPETRALETAAQDLEMGGYSNTMEYSPPHRKLYFGGGGGSGAFYSMDSAKKVTKLADAPEDLTCVGTSLAADPVTGDPLFLATGNSFHAYSASGNSWRRLTSPPAVLNGSTSVAAMATAIPEHGVVFYLSPTLKKVYLYKHSAGGAAARTARSRYAGMRVGPSPVGGLVINLPPERSGQGRIDILDRRGRLVAAFPAAAIIRWNPGEDLGPVVVVWRAGGRTAEARLAAIGVGPGGGSSR